MFKLKNSWSIFLYINFCFLSWYSIHQTETEKFGWQISSRFPWVRETLAKCLKNRIESVVMRHRSRQIATHAITLPLSVPIHATPSRRTNYKTAHAPSVGACLRFFGCITVEIGESPLMIKASIDRKSIPRHDKYCRWSVSIQTVWNVAIFANAQGIIFVSMDWNAIAMRW